eukprot:835820-Rhodomonas_salina.1
MSRFMSCERDSRISVPLHAYPATTVRVSHGTTVRISHHAPLQYQDSRHVRRIAPVASPVWRGRLEGAQEHVLHPDLGGRKRCQYQRRQRRGEGSGARRRRKGKQ